MSDISQDVCDEMYNELYAKYEKLLAFVKRMTDIGDLCCLVDIEEMAVKLLKEIGEG